MNRQLASANIGWDWEVSGNRQGYYSTRSAIALVYLDRVLPKVSVLAFQMDIGAVMTNHHE